MSSDADFIASLQLVQVNLYKFGGVVFVTLGVLGNIISLMVFTKKNLRKNPCSIYFTAVNSANLLLIFSSFLSTVLVNGYSIDPSSSNLIFCRFRFYAITLFDVLGPTYLIFASIDRVLLTSANALTRRRSTLRLAYASIISITVFWSICHSHVFVLTDIIEFFPGYFTCYFQLGIYLTFISYYSLIGKGILVPLSMIVLGLWTVRNLHHVGRVLPIRDFSTTRPATAVASRSTRSKDHQLIRILLVDISVYVLLSLMISVILTYQQVTQYQSKSLVQNRLEGFLLSVGAFCAYIPFCVGCYTNLLASKTFRMEVKNILMCR